MRTPQLLLVGATLATLLVAHPGSTAFAQDEETPSAEEADASETSSVDVEAEEAFPFRRGLYATGDFGGYFSFGGRNTNRDGVPSRTVSNFQPAIGVTLGYDLASSESINFAAGLRLAAAFNAGSGRPSTEQVTSGDARNMPSDFSIYQVGLGAKLGFLVLDRLAVNALVDLGLGIGNPDPAGVATQPDGADTALGFVFGVGSGVELATLFPGFSVGLDLRFMGTLLSNKFIPGLSITAPLKYNF